MTAVKGGLFYMQDFSDSCRIVYKGDDLMHDMSDYIKMVAKSMAVVLLEEDAKDIAMWLVQQDSYNDMLRELEEKINKEDGR